MLGSLFGLIATFYFTSALFILVVLGLIARFTGFSILRFLIYIKDELLVVLGTSSSESALPQLMAKLENLGCSRSVVGLVVPTGYSFNLDGTNIYMTLATLFIAQALEHSARPQAAAHHPRRRHADLQGRLGRHRRGLHHACAATLAAVDPRLVPGMAIVFSIDKFMSENRALTNIIGNGVATVVISAWEGELDRDRLKVGLSGEAEAASMLQEARQGGFSD